MVRSSMTCGEIRELYMKAYNEHKDEVDKITSEGIEKNRKGDCGIKIIDKDGNPVTGVNVKINQKKHDFKYGANIFMLDEFEDEENNIKYREFFKNYFNLATVPFYWDALEPEENHPRFAKDSKKIYRRPAPDLCVEYCEENDIQPKLHCLLYDKFTPEWLQKLPLEEAEKKYEKRVKEIAEHYKGKLYEFEVINEMLCPWNERTKLFYRDNVSEWAFEIAKKYLPDETLVINETFPVTNLAHEKTRFSYYMFIENLLMKGVPIDKIGIQNHLFTGVAAHTVEEYDTSVKDGVGMNNPMDYLNGLDVLAKFQLPIEITEITIPTFGDTQEHEELQADMLKLWYTIFFSHPSINEVVYWNTVDGFAYTGDPYWIENNCRGGLFHKDLSPKKSALMLKKLFGEIWHTDLAAETNQDGEIYFRGFYGEYEAEIDGKIYNFGVHKNESNQIEIQVK